MCLPTTPERQILTIPVGQKVVQSPELAAQMAARRRVRICRPPWSQPLGRRRLVRLFLPRDGVRGISLVRGMNDRPESYLTRRAATLITATAMVDVSCAERATPVEVPTKQPLPTPPPRPAPLPVPVPPAASNPATLRALLSENRRRDPVISGGLTNHLSMALSALAWLGGSDQQLQGLAGAHAPYLEPLRQAMPLPLDDWRAAVGAPQALVALSQYFEQQLSARGRELLLREVLPALIPGLSGALFHGMIRTAYALRAEDDAELALALAYFATVARPLRALPEPTHATAETADQLLRRALRDPRFGKRRGIADASAAFRVASELPGFDVTVAELQLHPGTIDDLARAALLLYLGTREFVALHAVTSTHALRLLLPYLAEPEVALRYQFQALLAACLGFVDRKLGEPSEVAPPEWSTLLAAVLTSTDDHDLKLVYTCLDEDRLNPSIAHRAAAALRLGIG